MVGGGSARDLTAKLNFNVVEKQSQLLLSAGDGKKSAGDGK